MPKVVIDHPADMDPEEVELMARSAQDAVATVCRISSTKVKVYPVAHELGAIQDRAREYSVEIMQGVVRDDRQAAFEEALATHLFAGVPVRSGLMVKYVNGTFIEHSHEDAERIAATFAHGNG